TDEACSCFGCICFDYTGFKPENCPRGESFAKYLQQLWNTVVLVALVLSTGVIVNARWQYQDNQFNDDLESDLKQDILRRLSALKTRIYRQPKVRCDPTQTQPVETDSCAVCLEQYNNNQCLRVLPCLHEFHRDCVDPWLLLQQTCPLCKRSVLGEKDRNIVICQYCHLIIYIFLLHAHCQSTLGQHHH
uniref:Ring finger protein 215 n=1 Tax=Sinocyclocheilus grahami TaxID=75366 RepID=A0A672S3K8_SINGR